MRIALSAAILALAGCATPARAPLRRPSPTGAGRELPRSCRAAGQDGFYYVYATQGEHGGRMLNHPGGSVAGPGAVGADGDALPVTPTWASKTQDFWAPHVSEA
jgi:arabinan endo-1,5-alpha-L-arabinosidase